LDTFGLVSLVVGLLSLVAAIVGVIYARDAAIVGRKALELAQAQAESSPVLEVSLDRGEAKFVVVVGTAKPRARRQTGGIFSLPTIDITEGDRDKADGLLRVRVFNAGTKPANGVTGWLRFSPAFCKPLSGGIATLMRDSGWTISEDDPYVVEIHESKLTPRTDSVFEIPVKALAPGQCAVSYELVCDEGATAKGELAVEVKPPRA
jgi:hypothetical protein